MRAVFVPFAEKARDRDIYIYIHAHTCVYIYIYICMCVSTSYIYIHICMCAHFHMQIIANLYESERTIRVGLLQSPKGCCSRAFLGLMAPKQQWQSSRSKNKPRI